MPSRIDEAGHTKAFDYPVAEHWEARARVKTQYSSFVRLVTKLRLLEGAEDA